MTSEVAEILLSLPPYYPYQDRLYSRINAGRRLLVSKYGTGKTRLALRYAWDAWQEKQHLPGDTKAHCVAFVFAPKRNMITWRREVTKWFPWVSIVPWDEVNLANVVQPSGDILVLIPQTRIRTEGVQMSLATRELKPACLVMDESTKIKNPKAGITEAALLGSQHALHCARIALTGKPMPEGPHEIWSQFQWAYPHNNPFGDTYYRFLRRWFVKTDYGYVLDITKRDHFYEIVRAHVVDMDDQDVQEHTALVGVTGKSYTMEYYLETPEQRKLIDQMYDEWALPDKRAMLLEGYTESEEDHVDEEDDSTLQFDIPEGLLEEESSIAVANGLGEVGAGIGSGKELYKYAISLLNKAQQIASGFLYHADGTCSVLRKIPKLELLREVVENLFVEDQQRQLIVWSRFVAERPFLLDALRGDGWRVVEGPDEEALISFSSTAADRAQIILMPAGVSQGFNELVGADTEIFYSNVYSQELRNQAEARIERLGQRASQISFIDLVSQRMADIDVVTALQSKDFTPARAATILNKYSKLSRKERLQEE